MDSDTDSSSLSQSSQSKSRLSFCEVCNFNEAKYSCPKCEVKTCCIKCVDVHKKELNCNGIRCKTIFIPIKSMTKMDFMSDYTFLEECTRYVADRKRDRFKRFTRYNKSLPAHLFKLRCAANDRKISLKFLLEHFSRHTSNTTYYDWKSKVIHWRVEWFFANTENLTFTDQRCNENDTLLKLVGKYFDADSCGDFPMTKSLDYYRACGVAGTKLLLKSEGIKKCKTRFYELDINKTLKENLAGKTIVEFPNIYVVKKESIDNFEVIDSDEDIEQETKSYHKELENKYGNNSAKPVKSEEEIRSEFENMQIQKKREERRLKREEHAKEPNNLLFTDEKIWDLLSSDTDSGDETEEESSLVKKAKV